MAEEKNTQDNRQVSVITQYVKDVSFENPNAPQSLQPSENKPDINVSVDVSGSKQGDDVYEVELKISANAKRGDENMFIAEVTYAGLFQLVGIPEEELQPALLIFCPTLLFPYVRRVISDVNRDGGFPALMLDPLGGKETLQFRDIGKIRTSLQAAQKSLSAGLKNLKKTSSTPQDATASVEESITILKDKPAISFFFLDYVVAGFFYIVGTMFIKGLKMLVVPLVFCSLIGGIVGMDDIKALGRTGGKAFLLFMFTTIIAISFGLFMAVSLGIGDGYDLSGTTSASFTASQAPGFADVVINFVPGNILGSMAEGNMLQVIAVCLLLGISILHSGESGKVVAKMISNLNDVIMALVNIVMSFAPIGVFCLMAKTFSEQGLEILGPIAGYFLTVASVLVLHYMGTFSGLFFIAKLNPITFLKKMKNVVLFAFTTASSNATLPITMTTCERRLGADNSIVSFVAPLGATINMNGTAIMQGVATVFVANVFQIDLSFTDYLTVIGMSVLASIGTAGVPGVGLIMLAMVFTQVGLPIEGIALIIGVDRLLDMMRTAVNVTGDAATTCIVAKSEGKLNMAVYNDPDAGEYEAIDLTSHDSDIKPRAYLSYKVL